MKTTLAIVCSLCVAAIGCTLMIAFADPEIVSPMIVGLALWASLPAVTVLVGIIALRKRRTLAVGFGSCGACVLLGGVAALYYSVIVQPDAFTGPVLSLLLIPLLEGLALTFICFISAAVAGDMIGPGSQLTDPPPAGSH
jgi:hypothetical protein